MSLDQEPLLQLFRKAAEHSREAIAIFDKEANTLLWHNRAFRHACQSDGELIGKSWNEVLPGGHDVAGMIPSGWQCFDDGGFTLVIQTDSRHYKGADLLTGAADRAQLEHHLAGLWESAQSSGEPPFALLFVDLDRFKQINDAWGHLTGDEALRQIAQRFQSALRSDDFLARFGGDEFVVLLTGWRQREDVAAVVDRLHQALRTPIELGEHRATVTASIGVAFSSDGHPSPAALLQAADRAMYAAKASMQERC